MSDTYLLVRVRNELEYVNEKLNRIKNKNMEYEEAKKILEKAYNVLENTKKTKNNSNYLKKTNELYLEVYMSFMPSCEEGIEELITCTPNYSKKILQKIL